MQLVDIIIEKSVVLIRQRGMSFFVLVTSFVFFLLVYGFVKYALGITIMSPVLILASWLLTVLVFHLSGRATLITGLGFLLSLPFPITSGREDLAVELASLAFFFLLTGTLQYLLVLLKEAQDDQNEF